MNIYAEQLSEVGRQEDASPDEASTWYNAGAPYSGNSTSFSSLSSFNGVLLEPATSSQSNIDAQSEVIYITTKDRIRGVSKEYKCERCFAVFNNSSNLKSHQRTHTGERPYVCDVCNAAFVQSSNLKSHRRIHTGERPFICKECGQTFARSSHLTGHKRTHTGEKPYMCGICNSNFTTSTHLRNHMRKHTGEKPYACHLCDMTFNQNSSLQIHLLVHTGERPFKCMVCPGAFRSKRDLLSHERLHSQVKPFLCHNCEKCFKTNQYLQKHLKKCGVPVIAKKRGRPRGNYNGASHMLSPNGHRIIRTNRSKSHQELCSYKDSSPEGSEHPDVPDFFEEF